MTWPSCPIGGESVIVGVTVKVGVAVSISDPVVHLKVRVYGTPPAAPAALPTLKDPWATPGSVAGTGVIEYESTTLELEVKVHDVEVVNGLPPLMSTIMISPLPPLGLPRAIVRVVPANAPGVKTNEIET